MKSYLTLIPISAKVRRRQNRMTILCIIFAVFLVTAIFSVANMAVRMITMHNIESHGNWHIKIEGLEKSISEEIAERISQHKDVAVSSWYDVRNLDMDKDYYIDDRKTSLCGVEEPFISNIMSYFDEGAHLHGEQDIILTDNARKLLGVEAGDSITLNTPFGNYDFIITGFRSGDARYQNSNGGESSALLVKDDQIGAFMNINTFRKICGIYDDDSSNLVYYVQFKKYINMKKAIEDIKDKCALSDENIDLNTIIMAANGISDKGYIDNMYASAAVLFVFILMAGVFMISSSLNSNISERSKFFGMLRCIGASKKQIIRFVRLEALNWCKSAIPIGVLLGIVSSWIVCAIMHYLVGGEFADMPIFGVSAIGVICGIFVGLLTVLLAAQSPAKRAAKVSPMAAVSGNTQDTQSVRHTANTDLTRIETTLGIHHAVSAKKNLILMTASFALSIILFFAFSIFIELVAYLLPIKSTSPDVEVYVEDFANSIEYTLCDEILAQNAVEHVLPRMYAEEIPAEFSKQAVQSTIDIISYSEYQFECLAKDKDLKRGSDIEKVFGDSSYVFAIYDKDNPLGIGDKIYAGGYELEIAGMLKYSPFSNDGSTNGDIIVICSEETFTNLTGERGYAIIDVQMTKNVADEDVEVIRSLADGRYSFRDRRSEKEIVNFTWAFKLFAYAFVAIIALITVLNIMNSVSMSVSARIRQYGTMRAVGMDERQLIKMIAAESFTYALSGCIVGCVVGLPLHKFLYDFLITSHFNYFTWSVPVGLLSIIVIFILVSVAAAIYAPSKRIKNMVVTELISGL